MKNRILSLCFLAGAYGAFADPISGLCSTGVVGPCSGGAGTGMLPTPAFPNPGTVDSNWTVSSGGPLRTFYVGPYFPNDSSSQWIGPTTHTSPITFTYSTTFNILPNQLPGTAEILGRYWGDNNSLGARLNGVAISIPLFGIGDFGGPGTAFAIQSGFQSGVNTLEFDIYNPHFVTAFRAQLSGTVSSVPEPGSCALLGIAGLFVTACRKLRRE